MRIAFLTDQYVTEPRNKGGLAYYLYRVTGLLAKYGHTPEVFTISDKSGDLLDDNGIPVHRVFIDREKLSRRQSLARWRLNLCIQFAAYSMALRKSFMLRHQGEPFDIIQISNNMSTGLATSISKPVPVVERLSGFGYALSEAYACKPSLDQRLANYVDARGARFADAIYAPSELLANTFRERFGYETEVIRSPFVIEESNLDESVLKAKLEGRLFMLFYGSIGRLKGVDLITEALVKLLPQYNKMNFVFAGNDLGTPEGEPMRKWIDGKLATYKERIIHFEQIPHAQLYPIIKGARAVILPSRSENIANAMLESMAHGKVVVGTRGASFDEVIDDGINGLLIENGDVDSLAAQMEKAWTMEEAERVRMGEEAIKAIAPFAPDKAITDLLDLYARVIKKKGGAS